MLLDNVKEKKVRIFLKRWGGIKIVKKIERKKKKALSDTSQEAIGQEKWGVQ